MKKISLFLFLLNTSLAFCQAENPFSLNQTFTFDKKIEFTSKVNGRDVAGDLLFNEKEGYMLLKGDMVSFSRDIKPDYIISFPKYKEDFVYLSDNKTGKKYSYKQNTDQSKYKPEGQNKDFYDYFKDNMEKTGQQKSIGDEGYKKVSDQYKDKSSDLEIFISSNTSVSVPQNSYLNNWSGLGYINFNDKTYAITKIKKGSEGLDLELKKEKDENYEVNGGAYETAEVTINKNYLDKYESEKSNKLTSDQKKLNEIEDAQEQALQKKIFDKENDMMESVKNQVAELARKQGKSKDIYKDLNALSNPKFIIENMKSKIELESYKAQKALQKEMDKGDKANAKKVAELTQKIQKVNEDKAKITDFDQKQKTIETTYQNDNKKKYEENNKLMKELMQSLKNQ